MKRAGEIPSVGIKEQVSLQLSFPRLGGMLEENVQGLSRIFLKTVAGPKSNITVFFLLSSSDALTGCLHNTPACLYLYCTHISQPCLKWDMKKESRTCPESVTPN